MKLRTKIVHVSSRSDVSEHDWWFRTFCWSWSFTLRCKLEDKRTSSPVTPCFVSNHPHRRSAIFLNIGEPRNISFDSIHLRLLAQPNESLTLFPSNICCTPTKNALCAYGVTMFESPGSVKLKCDRADPPFVQIPKDIHLSCNFLPLRQSHATTSPNPE